MFLSLHHLCMFKRHQENMNVKYIICSDCQWHLEELLTIVPADETQIFVFHVCFLGQRTSFARIWEWCKGCSSRKISKSTGSDKIIPVIANVKYCFTHFTNPTVFDNLLKTCCIQTEFLHATCHMTPVKNRKGVSILNKVLLTNHLLKISSFGLMIRNKTPYQFWKVCKICKIIP